MKQKWIWLLLLILSFTFGVAFTAFADAEYSDDRFSIKDVPIYVNIMDDAREGCWTNIGEVRTYIEDKLSEQGAVVADSVDFAVALKVELASERGIVASLASRISETEAAILKIQTEERDGFSMIIDLLIEVKSRLHLARVIKRIRILKQVQRVYRTTN